jgi:hypothetical protein
VVEAGQGANEITSAEQKNIAKINLYTKNERKAGIDEENKTVSSYLIATWRIFARRWSGNSGGEVDNMYLEIKSDVADDAKYIPGQSERPVESAVRRFHHHVNSRVIDESNGMANRF